MTKLVEIGIDMILNSVKEKEQASLMELLIYLQHQGAVTATDVVTGLATYTVQLEDLRCVWRWK